MESGAIILFGSGETAGVCRDALRWLRTARGPFPVVAVAETPAGFELNAEAVAARWVDYIRLQPEAIGTRVVQVAARRRGTRLSPDDADLASPLLGADLLAFGAGSPSYAVRQLQDSVTWAYAQAAHLMGASLLLASASAIAAGSFALPVYEIFKVGDDPHWKIGLGLFERYGLKVAVIPHWDNAEGGAGLDTSRCFIGKGRFAELADQLPGDATVVGLDEHTALAIDPVAASAQVLGRGSSTLLRNGGRMVHGPGTTFPLSDLGAFALPPASVVPDDIARAVLAARESARRVSEPPADVLETVAARRRARAAQDWETADRLRGELAARGWQVADTPDGPRVSPAEESGGD